MKKTVALLFVMVSFLSSAFCNGKQDDILEDIDNAFVPGFSFSAVTGFVNDKVYPGLDFHYAFIQGITTADSANSFGGFYEAYAEIGFYKEKDSPVDEDIFFTYVFGVNLSFEKFLNGSRNFLIPYFGAKAGGIYFNKSEGHGLLLEPVLGLVLFNNNSLNIDLSTSLFLNTVNLSDYIGLHTSLVISLNL